MSGADTTSSLDSPPDIEKTGSPTAPRLSLSIEAPSRLVVTLPYLLRFTIRRTDEGNLDNDRTCIVHFSPVTHVFSPSGLILLHHAADGSLEQVAIDHQAGVARPPEAIEPRPFKLESWTHHVWELAAPASSGGSTATPVFVATLPERYQRALVPGERYELLWPGQELDTWAWGTKAEHVGQQIQRRDPSRPRLVLPGGPRVSFVAAREDPPWPDRPAREAQVGWMMANEAERKWRLAEQRKREASPPPIRVSERVPGAPLLSVTLSCPQSVTMGEPLEVGVVVTYNTVSPSEEAKGDTQWPIVLHTVPFGGSDYGAGRREGFQLYRHLVRGSEATWEKCDDEDGDQGASGIFDDPPIPVRVGDLSDKIAVEDFISLLPGESWRTSETLQSPSWSRLPRNTTSGDVFKFVFKGAKVDWWDWGSRDEHRERGTVVKVPCWRHGRVVEPKDNGGRPGLVVPGAQGVEFRVIDPSEQQ